MHRHSLQTKLHAKLKVHIKFLLCIRCHLTYTNLENPCFGGNDCLVKNKNTTVAKLNNEKTEKEGTLINDWLPRTTTAPDKTAHPYSVSPA